jgi:hypothetical protein
VQRFYGLSRALPGVPGFLATVAGGSSSASLISASGDQDHTISPSAPAALVFRRLCVHRIPLPTFVTIGRSAPPERAGCGEISTFFGKTEGKFLMQGTEQFDQVELARKISFYAQVTRAFGRNGRAILFMEGSPVSGLTDSSTQIVGNHAG